jgi:hypothetical protein
MPAMLAINWEPEIRGILTVIIGTVVFVGSIYLVLGTNLGARLGFLVALTGLAGWMALMGVVWMFYGIGLKGPEPSWKEVPGRTVLQDTAALSQAGVLDARVEVPEDVSFEEESALVAEQFAAEGWVQVDPASPQAGQAGASAGEFLEETGAFEAGQFQVTRVFDTGGERYPMIGEFDLLAFFHAPHYVAVEVAPVELVREEPGRAAPRTQIDESRQRQYVYMIRDLGARRQPALVLTIGSGIVFLALCWLMHKREERVRINVSEPAPSPSAGS